jgi:sulfide dehydrogenase [flavocytochrome c] flavoprotein subunit
MNRLSRKSFLKLSAILGTTALGSSSVILADTKKKAKVVVIGGGFGGATCAKYIRRMDPSIEVTLVEKNKEYITCPMSNTVIGGINGMGYITHSYSKLQKHGIAMVHDQAVGVDPVSRTVKLKSGGTVGYDKLVVSPGISLVYEGVSGYSEEASKEIPHAWKAGEQTTILARQIKSMRAGGTVIVAPPDNPFRCPPGPYERVSMIAHYLKKHNPRAKIMILDAKDTFSKKPLFEQGWDVLYPGMIEFVAGSKGGKVMSIDVKSKTLETSSGKHKADVINLIPPQKAGKIAHEAGLSKGAWCPVKQDTFESEIHKDVYVIGDSSIAGPMPKSGFSANSQGKVCAAAIVASVNGINMPDPSYVNTCYSLVAPNYGISIAAIYNFSKGKIEPVPGSGGVSPAEVGFDFREQEALYAKGWYDSIMRDTLQ